jgi:hypothetical protein
MKNVIFLLMLLLLASCNLTADKATIFESKWAFKGYVFDDKDADFLQDANKYLEGNAQMDLTFFNNDTCAGIIEGEYTYGTYKVNDKKDKLVIKLKNDSTYKFENIEKINSNLLHADLKNVGKFEFNVYPNLKNIYTDYLHPINNQWRIKAKQTETDLQLKERLKNLLVHYIYLIENSVELNKTSVDFNASESIIKIYNGGIGIFEETPENWEDYFYDKADMERFSNLFRKILRESPAPLGKGSGKWVEDDVRILKTLYAYLETKVFKQF